MINLSPRCIRTLNKKAGALSLKAEEPLYPYNANLLIVISIFHSIILI